MRIDTRRSMIAAATLVVLALTGGVQAQASATAQSAPPLRDRKPQTVCQTPRHTCSPSFARAGLACWCPDGTDASGHKRTESGTTVPIKN